MIFLNIRIKPSLFFSLKSLDCSSSKVLEINECWWVDDKINASLHSWGAILFIRVDWQIFIRKPNQSLSCFCISPTELTSHRRQKLLSVFLWFLSTFPFDLYRRPLMIFPNMMLIMPVQTCTNHQRENQRGEVAGHTGRENRWTAKGGRKK